MDRQERSELLQYNAKKDKNANRVPLVVTFSNLLPDVHGIIRKYMDVLNRSNRMKEVFQEPPIVAFKRDKNLFDTLVLGKPNAALKLTSMDCKKGCKNCVLLSRDGSGTRQTNSSYNRPESGT